MSVTKQQVINWLITSNDDELMEAATVFVTALSLNQTRKLVNLISDRFSNIDLTGLKITDPSQQQNQPESPLQQQNQPESHPQPPTQIEVKEDPQPKNEQTKKTPTEVWIEANNADNKVRTDYYALYKAHMLSLNQKVEQPATFIKIMEQRGYAKNDTARPRKWKLRDQ